MHQSRERDGEEERISTRWKDSRNRDTQSVGLKMDEVLDRIKGTRKIQNNFGDPRWWEKPRRTMNQRALCDKTSYLCIFSRAWATTVRGFRTWDRRLGWRRGRQRFHWVTHPAWITPGLATRTAFWIASSHFLMAASRT